MTFSRGTCIHCSQAGLYTLTAVLSQMTSMITHLLLFHNSQFLRDATRYNGFTQNLELKNDKIFDVTLLLYSEVRLAQLSLEKESYKHSKLHIRKR